MSQVASNPFASPVPAGALPRKENIKETIESILVAFILAFVFRAFVVEAFVIPSGSMATTLLGAHMRYRCQECGYQFDVNYPSVGQDNPEIRSRMGPLPVKESGSGRVRMNDIVVSSHCPNCEFQVPADHPDPEQSAKNSAVHYGDRILVLKYLYLFEAPKRWDVVVFKTPYDEPKREYQQNYIKRLIGLPGEQVMLLDGDVYVSTSGSERPAPEQWTIQTKPQTVQDALWRIVYDNDFVPLNQHGWRRNTPRKMPWRQAAGSGWNVPEIPTPQSRVLEFDNASGSGTLVFDKDVNRGSLYLSDWLPYNETVSLMQHGFDDPRLSLGYDAYSTTVSRWHVSDVKLQFAYERLSGQGALRGTLTKDDDAFTAEFGPASVKLIHRNAAGQARQLAEAKLPSGPLDVQFTNVDYQVTVRVNGEDLIQTTPGEYRPNVAGLLKRYEDGGAQRVPPRDPARAMVQPARIEIQAESQTCRLEHVSVWRDTYYTPPRQSIGPWADPDKPVKLRRTGDPASSRSAASATENEYFVLGDNSILSQDARAWNVDVDLVANEDLFIESGRVPERFMLGKAFFVYWPAGHRSPIPGVRLVPNFGEMRFIR